MCFWGIAFFRQNIIIIMLQCSCFIWKAANVILFFSSKLMADIEEQHVRGGRSVFRYQFSID